MYFNDLWQSRAAGNKRFWHDDGFSYRICQREAVDGLGDLSGKKVLLLGAGRGYEANLFLERGAWVCVTDLLLPSSDDEIEGRICKAVMDAEQLFFGDNTFDLVYAQSMLMFVDKKKVLQEARRVLRKGGRFVSVEPLSEGALFWILKKTLTHFDRYTYLGKKPPRYMKMEDVQLMRDIFDKEICVKFRILTPLYHIPRMLNATWMVDAYMKVERAVVDSVKCLQRQCFLGLYVFEK